MVGHGGSSAGSYLADPSSPIPSHSAVIILFKIDSDFQGFFILFMYVYLLPPPPPIPVKKRGEGGGDIPIPVNNLLRTLKQLCWD